MTQHRTLGWTPERTWVFVVGTLAWKHAEFFDPFPKENRRDAALVEFFRARGIPIKAHPADRVAWRGAWLFVSAKS